jgi:hypothetical protein
MLVEIIHYRAGPRVPLCCLPACLLAKHASTNSKPSHPSLLRWAERQKRVSCATWPIHIGIIALPRHKTTVVQPLAKTKIAPRPSKPSHPTSPLLPAPAAPLQNSNTAYPSETQRTPGASHTACGLLMLLPRSKTTLAPDPLAVDEEEIGEATQHNSLAGAVSTILGVRLSRQPTQDRMSRHGRNEGIDSRRHCQTQKGQHAGSPLIAQLCSSSC